jgi:hypothetical protein
MINFNEVYYKSVQKEAVAWTESLSTMLFDLPREGLKDLKIPLSPAIFKRVWPESIRSKAFHLTDFEGVHKLKKIQGGKKSISAFYNMEDHMIQSGIRTQGGYVVELEGDVLAAAPDDISSQPDKTGRRWLTFSSLMNSPTASDPGLNGRSKLKRIEKDLENLLIDILVKNDLGPYKKGLTTRELNRAWSYLGKSTGGKEKSIIIKDYIDGMEKIMKKYSKPLKSIFTDYTKKRTLDPDPDSGDTAMWDELVVNKFKIQKIHVAGGYLGPDYHDDEVRDRHSKILSELGFPFELYEDVGDLVDYINRKVLDIKL